MTMIEKHITALGVLAVAAALTFASPVPAEDRTPGHEVLAPLVGLAGEWVAAEDGQQTKKGEVVARWAVTAAGTAVMETVFPGAPHEMVTVYHADGPDLVLTHYCIEGNQPQMRARGWEGSRAVFTFDGGTNVDPAWDRHMHSAWIELVGPDEIRSQWTAYAEGEPDMVVAMHLRRKSS
jgi:hypothetical protein